jgi:hypothetical protein
MNMLFEARFYFCVKKKKAGNEENKILYDFSFPFSFESCFI